jgi:hypothetical protein
LHAALAASLGTGALAAHAEAFTYHGHLQDGGRPAEGTYDLELTLYSRDAGGSVVGGPVTLRDVRVHDGSFVTQVDFGPLSAAGGATWLDVRVKSSGAGDFVGLGNRTPVETEGTCPGSWTTDGNVGLTSDNFVGTADSGSVQIRANNELAAVFSGTVLGSAVLAPYTVGSGTYATSVSYANAANGAYSFAGGYTGGTEHSGSFVWGDASGSSITDSAANQFIVKASGGVGINTAQAADGGALLDELTIAPSPDLPGPEVADFTMLAGEGLVYKGFDTFVVANGYYGINGLYYDGTTLSYDTILFANYIHGSSSFAQWRFNGANGTNPFQVGYNTTTGNGAYLSGSGVWTNASSRTWKENFADIDVEAVLGKLVSIPVRTWFYKDNHGDGKHMGPVAEDFAGTFGLGSDDKYIGTVDEGGVALAAIQGLNKKVDVESKRLADQNAELRDRLDAALTRLERLESGRGE